VRLTRGGAHPQRAVARKQAVPILPGDIQFRAAKPGRSRVPSREDEVSVVRPTSAAKANSADPLLGAGTFFIFRK